MHRNQAGRRAGLAPVFPRRLARLMLLALICLGPAALALPAPDLESDSEVATAGFYQLTWQGDEAAGTFELQEATQPDLADARDFYRGPDLATVFSGQPNGDYYYRIRAIDGETVSPWSPTVHVVVQHHSLARAFTFLALGALVFIATVVLILRGEARTRS